MPIPKKENPRQLTNLRPIYLIPLPGKIFERIIHRRPYKYLEDNNLFCSEQGGFMTNRSTCQTVMDLTNYVHRGFNKDKRCTIATFAEITKAFDSIDQNLLLQKLPYYGITGKILASLKIIFPIDFNK